MNYVTLLFFVILPSYSRAVIVIQPGSEIRACFTYGEALASAVRGTFNALAGDWLVAPPTDKMGVGTLGSIFVIPPAQGSTQATYFGLTNWHVMATKGRGHDVTTEKVCIDDGEGQPLEIGSIVASDQGLDYAFFEFNRKITGVAQSSKDIMLSCGLKNAPDINIVTFLYPGFPSHGVVPEDLHGVLFSQHDPVIKSGRTTGVTESRITGFNVEGRGRPYVDINPVATVATHGIEESPLPGHWDPAHGSVTQAYSLPGDSGSAVYLLKENAQRRMTDAVAMSQHTQKRVVRDAVLRLDDDGTGGSQMARSYPLWTTGRFLMGYGPGILNDVIRDKGVALPAEFCICPTRWKLQMDTNAANRMHIEQLNKKIRALDPETPENELERTELRDQIAFLEGQIVADPGLPCGANFRMYTPPARPAP